MIRLSKSAVIYFSRAEENYFDGALRYIEKGNTKVIAEKIADEIDADIFEIKMLNPYSDNYRTCTEQAKEDLQKGVRPEIEIELKNLDGYTTVYLGYPNYWNTIPMPVLSAIEKFNWDGITICPFCTHEGSGLGCSVKDIQKAAKGASVSEAISIYGSQRDKSDDIIKSWIGRIQK